MKILFLLLDYSKELNQIGLYKELIYEFKEKNIDIYVATPSEKKYGFDTELNIENGIKVLRIKTGNMFNVSFIEKGWTNLKLGNDFQGAIKKYFKDIKFDVVVHHTPPITFTPVISYLKKKYNTKSYLILRDIFPQNARDLGIIKNRFLFNFFRKKEKKLYEMSDYIGCMSKGNIDYLIKYNPEVDNKKLHILKNWGKIKPEIAINKQDIRKKYGFKESDFILVFGGNMGKPQGLEFILKIASEYRSNKNIKFLFIGKGNEKEKLQSIKNKQNLENVIFLDFIPREEYEILTGACDIGIVSLHSSFTIPNIPSKTVDYCKLGLPIIASIDERTDYGNIIENEINCGLYSIYGDVEKYKNNLNKLYMNESLRKILGENARKYYENELGVNKAYEVIMKQINRGKNV